MKYPEESEAVTQGIRVRAIASYLSEQSNPEKSQYLYGYKIQITNTGTEKARLLSRHWLIINSNGKRFEVNGPGVVGEFPELAPGESFEYASYCPLDTDFGTMEGEFTMMRATGEKFAVKINRFYLAANSEVDLESYEWRKLQHT